jgi:competence protein ComEC
MADRGKARGRVEVWRPWGVAGRPSIELPHWLRDFFQRALQRLGAWLETDIGPGRLVPWLAVFYGLGIVLYFTADREPDAWAAAAMAVATIGATVFARNRPLGFPIALALAAVAAGFATATVKRTLIEHPVLSSPAWNVDVTGFVEIQEERERSDRITVRVHGIEGARLSEKLERVRVAVRKGTGPAVGSFVAFKARLSPPLEQLMPGGYDFARDMYFKGIGASGFVLGRIRVTEPPVESSFWLRYATFIDGMRSAIDQRIRAVVKGDHGAIASALITGKRDAISTPVNDAMFVSGLGHVLSVSGYHMVIVVGIVLFAMRGSLALIQAFAPYPIKKWAALVALGVAAFYLLLSGAEVATQRSFIMIAIVLAGVLLDRPAITLRTLTVAALGVLLLAPESVVHPSFQMSFAATLALVAGYSGGVRWLSAGADTPRGARIALWGGRQAVMLLLSSFVAGLATTLFAAYHFHRLAPFGTIANLLAMPVVSAWVMPAGILGVLAMPFGFDGVCWWAMGVGIDWMIKVSLWVADLPGAVGRMPAFGVGPLLLGSAGIIVFCLLKTPLRLAGAAFVVIASVWALRGTPPDILVAATGESVAVRSASGQLAIVRTGSDTFAAQQWLAADADPRSAKDKALGQGITCDDAGCVGRMRDGTIVAMPRTLEAFEEDCRRAAVIVSARVAPRGCEALVIDRKITQRNGALALRRTDATWGTASGAALGTTWEVTAARPDGHERPWARAARPPEPGSPPARPGNTRPQPRDATPQPEDLQADDH